MSEISRSEYRAALKFLTLEKQPANNIYERLVNVYAPSYSTITIGGLLNLNVPERRYSLEDDTLAGRPVEATTDACCHAVEKLVTGDRRLKVLHGDSHRSGRFTWQRLEYFA